MGTIVTRKRKDGTASYTAQIVVKSKGAQPYREAKTFVRLQAAKAWVAKRETEIRQNGPPTKETSKTIADAIDTYVDKSLKQIGRTKAQVLRSIKDYEIAKLDCDAVTSQDIVQLAEELAADKQPQTVGNYISHLSAIFAIARPAWGFPLNPQAMKDAQAVMKRLGLTGKSRARDRRPTLDELDKLMRHFGVRQIRRPEAAPMQKVIAFAIFSTRRQEEICRIAWADLDEEHKRVLVRDMKHPGEKIGNDTWCDLPDEALAIIKAMPRHDEKIFPYTTDAIGAAFTRACAVLAIEDLHFHDLRHDGVSRLFELGWNIPHVAAVSGHRSWTSLKRYTHIRQRADKYAGWRWLEEVVQTNAAAER